MVVALELRATDSSYGQRSTQDGRFGVYHADASDGEKFSSAFDGKTGEEDSGFSSASNKRRKGSWSLRVIVQ